MSAQVPAALRVRGWVRRRSPFDVLPRGRYIGTPFHWAGTNWLCIDEYEVDGAAFLLLRRYQDEAEELVPRVRATRPWWWTEQLRLPEQACPCCRQQRPLAAPRLPLTSVEERRRHASRNGDGPVHATDPPLAAASPPPVAV